MDSEGSCTVRCIELISCSWEFVSQMWSWTHNLDLMQYIFLHIYMQYSSVEKLLDEKCMDDFDKYIKLLATS